MRITSDDVVERGTVIAGRYVVHEPIGEGALSVVYAVEHVRTGERFAMKILRGRARLDPEALERFKREARTAARIRSDHVVLVTDADTAPELDGAPFMVMQLLEGDDLETLAVRDGPLAPDRVVSILAQVGSALEQAHRLGIIHRDLKPENLFLHRRPDGSTIAKVLDFGLSKLVSASNGESLAAVTSTGAVLGTPLYMSPEQAHGKNHEVGPTTDVWALGLIALRLLAGEHYWGRPTMAELITKITILPMPLPSERWPNARTMSPALDAWFLRSCDRDRTKRWPSVAEQIAALEQLFTSTEAAARSVVAAPTERKPNRRLGVALGAIALVTVAVAPWLLKRGHEDSGAKVDPVVTAPTSAPLPIASSAPSAESLAAVTSASSSAHEPPAPASRAPVVPVITCGPGETRSFGHCCPAAHVWQSGRCTRPLATSF